MVNGLEMDKKSNNTLNGGSITHKDKYYLTEDENIDLILVPDRGYCYFSLYDDNRNISITCDMSKKDLKGLAEFILKYLE
jgi:hypothetical protein